MLRSAVLAAMSLLALSGEAPGQSLNIDLGPEAGVPSPSYAGAGLRGMWNAITAHSDFPPPPVFGPFALVGLNGQPTGATISLSNTVGTFDVTQPPPPESDDARLMFDGLLGYSPDISQNIEIHGLNNGLYRVITHTWAWPTELYAMVVFVTGSDVVQPVGGPWPGQLTVGVTTMVHVVEVVDGTIELEIVGAGPGAFFNGNNIIQGLQLWKIDEPLPCPADIAPKGDGNQTVDVDDLFAVIAAWGQADGVEDINMDGTVDIDDLFVVVGAYGPCPTAKPGKCGDPSLGSCYEPHNSGGCIDEFCCQAICASDPFCCDVAWDELCAGFANLSPPGCGGLHPNCGNPNGGDCFETVNPIQPGCIDETCCDMICAFDPFCCTYGWDSLCVQEASAMCDQPPP
jgi:hypothetical protein